jgi:hypothetical protein
VSHLRDIRRVKERMAIFMNLFEGLEVLLVGLGTLLVAVGLAASALRVLFTCLLHGERRPIAE